MSCTPSAGPGTEDGLGRRWLEAGSMSARAVLPYYVLPPAGRASRPGVQGCAGSRGPRSLRAACGVRVTTPSALLEPGPEEGRGSVTSPRSKRESKGDQPLLCSHVFAAPWFRALKIGLKRMSSMQVNTLKKQFFSSMWVGCPLLLSE